MRIGMWKKAYQRAIELAYLNRREYDASEQAWRKEVADLQAALYRRQELIALQDKEITRLHRELRELRNQATPTNPGDQP
jgi:hypothetical protein